MNKHVMAAHGYYVQSGNMAAVLVTAGAGISNALTGVVGSWADGVPVLILSGQESTKQFTNNNLARMIGVQGVYVESIYNMYKKCCYCHSPEQVLKTAKLDSGQNRSSRSLYVDIPDLQSAYLGDNAVNEVSLLNQPSQS